MRTSRPRRRASSRPRAATRTGSEASENTGTSMLAPRVRNCSTAAGRCRSAPTSSGLRPCCFIQLANLAEFVVLPEPWRPAIKITVGGFEAKAMRRVSPPRIPVSSALTALMTCWPGSRACERAAPIAFSRIRLTTDRTTVTLTSASRRAVRISRITSSTSASVRRPLPRSRVRMPSNREERVSNMLF